MKNDKKIQLLTKYESEGKFTDKELKNIIEFSKDEDALVRSRAADLLINFENDKAKKALLKLAGDKKSLVRVSAYDSLSVFKDRKIEKVLKKAILKEKNELACSYAIMAWGDIAVTFDNEDLQNELFLKKIKKTFKVKKSEHCMLSCRYVEYIMKDKKNLMKIIDFLKSPNYQVRCGTINILREFVCENNKDFIKRKLKKTEQCENSIAVKTAIKNVIEN